MTPPAAAGLSPLGKAFFGSLCAGTFGLGCWQTQRFFEKQEQMEQREHDLALDPEPLTSDYNTSSLRRKVVEGAYRHDKEVLVGPRGAAPGAIASSGPSASRTAGGMSSSPQVTYADKRYYQ
jgi:cytochrome oxidase assembly protein ShyY1